MLQAAVPLTWQLLSKWGDMQTKLFSSRLYQHSNTEMLVVFWWMPIVVVKLANRRIFILMAKRPRIQFRWVATSNTFIELYICQQIGERTPCPDECGMLANNWLTNVRVIIINEDYSFFFFSWLKYELSGGGERNWIWVGNAYVWRHEEEKEEESNEKWPWNIKHSANCE